MTTKIEWVRNPDGLSQGETWNPVLGYPDYYATKNGKLRGPAGKVLKQMKMPDGHLYVLCNRGKGKQRKLFVHRAVLLAFNRRPRLGEETRHLNGNPADNRLVNLAWGNRFQQRQDDKRNGVERGRPQKLNKFEVSQIRNLRGSISSRAAGDIFGVSHTTIQRIWRREIWAQVK